LFRNVRMVTATNTSPLPVLPAGGRAAAAGQTEAIVGGSAPALTPNQTLQGLAVGIGDPLHPDVLAAGAGKPVVPQQIINTSSTVLGLGALGGQYVTLESSTPGVFEPLGTAGPSVTSTSSVDFTLNASALAGEDLKLGLLG